MRLLLLRHAVAVRRVSLLWWTVGLVVGGIAIAATYPSVAKAGGGLDEYAESLPEELMQLFGADSFTSPSGYLNSQWFANMFPLLLLVFGVGMAAWAVAGAEQDGTLETALANPVTRRRLALERFAAVTLLLLWLATVATLGLTAVRGAFDLGDVGVVKLLAAGAGCFALALAFAALTFAVGAATGSRGLAIGIGAGAAAITYVTQALALFVDPLDWLTEATPWGWFLESEPLQRGFSWELLGWPLLVSLALAVAGTLRFERRDLR